MSFVTVSAAVLLLLGLVSLSQATFFMRAIPITDPYNQFSMTSIPTAIVGSLLECSAHANAALMSADKTKRRSAFKWDSGVCTLGRTPPFLDKVANNPVITNASGIHSIIKEKPLSSVAHADLYFYVLMNEEQYFNAHVNLPNPPNSAYFDGVTKKFSFTMLSPVQTLEGQYAAQPVSAGLEFNIATHTFTGVTYLVWYNSGASAASNDPLVSLGQPFNAAPGFDFWAGGSGNAGNMEVNIGLDAAAAATLLGLGISLGGLLSGPTPPSIQTFDTSNNVVPANTWVYLGVTYDTQTRQIVMYMNGTAVKQVYADVSAFALTTNLFRVGFQGSSFLDQYIASVEVYARALTPAQVLASMAISTVTRTLVPVV